MRTIHRNLLMAGAVATAVVALPFVDATQHAALADSSSVFSNLTNKGQDLFYNVRTVVLVVCALAIVGTMATAITGRFPITKAFSIMAAIVVIGLASQIVTYFAGATSSAQSSSIPSMTDTAQSGSP